MSRAPKGSEDIADDGWRKEKVEGRRKDWQGKKGGMKEDDVRWT